MTAERIALGTTVVMLFPMIYFLLVTPTFFLAKLEDPITTWLMRGLFNVYFNVVIVVSAIAAVAFVIAGRPLFTLGIALIVACAIMARRWFLQHFDADLRARDAGDVSAVRRLRKLHVGAMLYNAVQVAAVVAAIPSAFVTLT